MTIEGNSVCKKQIRLSDDQFNLICKTYPLTDIEKTILDRARRGERYIDIGLEVGYCEKSISRILSRIQTIIEQ